MWLVGQNKKVLPKLKMQENANTIENNKKILLFVHVFVTLYTKNDVSRTKTNYEENYQC